jgi:hypothetical protein
MSDSDDSLMQLLTDVVMPTLISVQGSQAEQVVANDRLENAIEELRLYLDAQFAHLSAQLTACRAELAATQAIVKASHAQKSTFPPNRITKLN